MSGLSHRQIRKRFLKRERYEKRTRDVGGSTWMSDNLYYWEMRILKECPGFKVMVKQGQVIRLKRGPWGLRWR